MDNNAFLPVVFILACEMHFLRQAEHLSEPYDTVDAGPPSPTLAARLHS